MKKEIKKGDLVKIIGYGATGGRWNPRGDEQKEMMDKNFIVEKIEYGYPVCIYNNYHWHFSLSEVEKVEPPLCDKCGHTLIDSYEE